jgi:hypothetical protein
VIVTVVLATILLLGLGTAMARDAILFPYFTSGGGDVTFFQIINTAKVQTAITGTSQGKLDYTYVYNSSATKEVCTHYDDVGRVTQNDILLYEATGVYPGQLLPGDTTSTSPKLTVSPAWGYLVVKHNTSNFATGLEGSLFGQAYVANVNTGTVFAYNAINDPQEVDSNFDFDSSAEDDFILSFLPETFASTQWYFFPVDDTDLTETDGIVWNNLVEVGTHSGGIFDNNESLKSGYKLLMVGCWDETIGGNPSPVTANFFYTLQQIMSGAQYNAVKGTGGFTDIQFHADAYVYKLQTSTVLGKPMNIFIYETQEDSQYSYTK